MRTIKNKKFLNVLNFVGFKIKINVKNFVIINTIIYI